MLDFMHYLPLRSWCRGSCEPRGSRPAGGHSQGPSRRQVRTRSGSRSRSSCFFPFLFLAHPALVCSLLASTPRSVAKYRRLASERAGLVGSPGRGKEAAKRTRQGTGHDAQVEVHPCDGRRLADPGSSAKGSDPCPGFPFRGRTHVGARGRGVLSRANAPKHEGTACERGTAQGPHARGGCGRAACPVRSQPRHGTLRPGTGVPAHPSRECKEAGEGPRRPRPEPFAEDGAVPGARVRGAVHAVAFGCRNGGHCQLDGRLCVWRAAWFGAIHRFVPQAL